MTALIRIALVAIALALDVFAVCVGVGIGKPPFAQRVRIGLAFATAEVSMSVAGVALGHATGELIGDAAAYLGFTALVCLGLYMIFDSRRDGRREFDLGSGWGLFVSSLSISLDSLGIGFTLPYLGVPVLVALATIFAVSLTSTACGLALGGALGRRVGAEAGLAAGIVLMLTGGAFGLAHALGIG